VPFLKLMGVVAGGWQMARGARGRARAAGRDRNFLEAKIATARFYAITCLCRRRRCATPWSTARPA